MVSLLERRHLFLHILFQFSEEANWRGSSGGVGGAEESPGEAAGASAGSAAGWAADFRPPSVRTADLAPIARLESLDEIDSRGAGAGPGGGAGSQVGTLTI